MPNAIFILRTKTKTKTKATKANASIRVLAFGSEHN